MSDLNTAIREYAPGAAERNLSQYLRRRYVRETTLGIAVPILLLILWQVGADLNWLDRRNYPPPTDLIEQGWKLINEGTLGHDILVTLRRVLIGFAIGTTAGVLLGFAMATSRNIRAALEPTLSAFYVVPKLALLPVFLTIFGFGEAPKVVLVAVTVFFFVWIDTMESVSSIPDGYREAAEVFGCSPWQMFVHVLMPAFLPRLFIALRIAIGVAVLVIIAAEFVVSRDGLGYLIFNSRQLFINGWMYVGIVCVALMGVILAAIVGRIGLLVTPWEARSRRSKL
jgi:sulfonate transport system permease protein